MGLEALGTVGQATWWRLFSESSYAAGGNDAVNRNYTGDRILSELQIGLCLENMAFYQEAVAGTAVPWEMLGAVHYRETKLERIGIDGGGPYQDTKHIWPDGYYDDDMFRAASVQAASDLAKNSAEGGHTDLTAADNIKFTFGRYNGLPAPYFNQGKALGFTDAQADHGEGSPYVMNRYDAARDPAAAPHGTWGQYKWNEVWPGDPSEGSYVYPANPDFGAWPVFCVLAHMGG
jgi:hypothetical protein